jgi:outer membrane autotransporter protein
MDEQDKLAAADDGATDPLDNLNWSSRPPYPSTWTGITWGSDGSGFDKVYIISVYNQGLTGTLVLNGFERLAELDASVNGLTSLQFDDNPALYSLAVFENQLSTLDVTGVPLLERLDASYNYLDALNVKNNPALNLLYAEFNGLVTIDLSGNPLLRDLNLSYNNLVALDLSGNPALLDLDLSYNYLGDLDLSGNPLLQYLDVSSNYLDSLDVDNSPDLLYLGAADNFLESLNVSYNVSLTYLDASSNFLDYLDVSLNPDLQHLDVGDNYFDSLDVSYNQYLEELSVYNNYFEDLDLSGNPNLKTLSAWGNYLESVDVSDNPLLEYLDLDFNYVSSLDITQNPNLKELSASFNELEDLFLDANGALERLDVSNNFWLDYLDLSDATSLKYLDVSGDWFDSLDLSANALLEHLNVSGNAFDFLDLSDNTALEYLDASGNWLDSLDLSDNALLKHLDVSDNTYLDALDVSDNTALEYLDASGNSIVSLDLSDNAALEYLDISGNSIASLDLSVNGSLQYLDASRNSLNSLVLGSVPDLQYLDVSQNQLLAFAAEDMPDLQYLDVSGNPLLTTLSVKNSGLSSLDLSDTPSITDLDVSGNKFTLSALYALMTLVQDLNMGGQTDVALDSVFSYPEPGVAYDLSSEAIFNGVATIFTVEVNGFAAVSGADYAISPEGEFTFMDRGQFWITMENPEVHGKGLYSSSPATVVSALIDVLPGGELVVWAGDASSGWAPEGAAASAKNWLYNGYGVRYLDFDDVTFEASAQKDVAVDAFGVTPWTVTVEDDGYAFSGGAIDGSALVLAAAPGSSTRFSNEISFAYGAEVQAGNELVFDYGAAAYPWGVTSALSIYGEGSVTKDGDGALTLSSASDYSGVTSVLMGTLKLGPGADVSRSLAGGGLALSGGATFDISSYGASLAIPKLAVDGGDTPAVIEAGLAVVADFSGADISWSLPQSGALASPLLKVNGEAQLDSGVSFSITNAPARLGLALGEGLILLAADTLVAGGLTALSASTPDGDSFSIAIDPGDATHLLATLVSLSPWTPSYERLKAYSESAVAALAFAAQGQDALVREGLSAATRAVAGPGLAWGAFGAAAGGRSRYNSGSHADVSGFSVMAGAAVGAELGLGRLALGIFAEAGRGDYDSHNSFANSRGVDGSGDATYAGGGLLARWDAAGGAFPGLYLEASARFGRQETDFDTDDIRYSGERASFKFSGAYWGFHGGLGRAWKPAGPDGSFTLDLGARLLWTRQEGSDFRINIDRIRFADADSLRVRVGGRLAYGVGGRAAPYAGAYYEREFDGIVRATANGVPLEAPSLKGNTGIFELGVAVRPSETIPLTLELGAQGYVGKREGVSGSLTLKYGF